jgi:hypothetical protein
VVDEEGAVVEVLEVDEVLLELEVVGSSVVVDVGAVVVVTTLSVVVGPSVVVVVVGAGAGASVGLVRIEPDVVVSLDSESDFVVWACALGTIREPMPPLVVASAGARERSSVSSPVDSSLSERSSVGTAIVFRSARTAWMARGAATPSAVTVDSVRARRKRVRPDASPRW